MAEKQDPFAIRRMAPLPQHTLRAANVGTLRQAFSKPSEESLKLVEATGLKPLIIILNHQHPKIKATAKKIVESLQTNSDEEPQLDEKIGWPAMADLLSYKDDSAQAAGLQTLAALSSSNENAEFIIKYIGIKTLAEFAVKPDEGLQLATAQLIANLAQYDELRNVILENLCQALVNWTKKSDPELLTAISVTFYNLTLSEEGVNELGKRGVLDFLLKAIQNTDPAIVAPATKAIANFGEYAGNTYEKNLLVAIAPVTKGLSNSNIDILRSNCTAVASLGKIDSLHAEFIKAGVVSNLVDIILGHQNDSDTLFVAIKAFTLFANHADSKINIKKKGFIELMSKLAQSKDAATRHAATEALSEMENLQITQPSVPVIKEAPPSYAKVTPATKPAAVVKQPPAEKEKRKS